MIAIYVAAGFFVGTIVGVTIAALLTASKNSEQIAAKDRQALERLGEHIDGDN